MVISSLSESVMNIRELFNSNSKFSFMGHIQNVFLVVLKSGISSISEGYLTHPAALKAANTCLKVD